MDNASKALVMAGAILIAVMLISLGVMLFNQGQDIATRSSHITDSMLIQTYNSSYQMFEGGNRSASEARTLISKVNAHNANTQEAYDYGVIDLTSPSTVEISTEHKYNIELTDFDEHGAVSAITIEEAD